MQRRKLTAFTLMFAAGITAGFFITERSRTAESVMFMVSVIATAIFCAPFDDAGRVNSVRFRAILIIMFAAGIFSLCARYACFSKYTDQLPGYTTMRCRIISISQKDDTVRLTVKNPGDGPPEILVTADARILDTRSMSSLIGSEAEIGGEPGPIYSADNPGCFDYSLYMKARGICAGLKAYSITVTDPRNTPRNRVRRYLLRQKEQFLSRFDPETAGFIRGMLFGDKSRIDEDIIREFNENSTGHILAVSGLHMGFLYGLLKLLSGKKRSLSASLFMISVMFIYGDMTMWSPATIRAFLVISLRLMSVHLRRPFDMLTSVSFAALMILAAEPYQLFDTGFQLSFCAMAGMSLLVKPVASVTGEALGVMISVQVSTLPVIAYTYGAIDPLAIFINIPVILLASVLVPFCILMMAAGILGFMLPAGAFDLAELMSYAVIKINHVLYFGGSFSIRTAGTGAFGVIIFYMAVMGMASEWTRIRMLRKEWHKLLRAAVLLLIPALIMSCCLYDRFSDDEVVFVSVGQGDCTHIRCGDNDILIDGGGQAGYGDDDAGFNVGERILKPYLLREGAENVDIALLTHLHTDHYKGITELAAVFPVGVMGIPADYRGSDLGGVDGLGSTESHQIIYMEPGSTINLSEDVSIEVIWPVKTGAEPLEADDPNEHNTVYMIHYGTTKIMVTGDLLEEDEMEMVDYYEGTDTLKCDVLKVGHHGSKSSSSEAFLDAASPKIAVIQVGRNNLYGHPHQQTVERLESRGIQVFRTDENGAVGLDLKSSRIMVDLFHTD